MLLRYAISFPLAALVTFGIFYVMQSLISMEGGPGQDYIRTGAIDFVRLKRESDLQTRKRQLPEKQQKKAEPPPPPDLNMAKAQRPDASGVSIAVPSMNANLSMAGGLNLGAAPADTEATPILRVPPIYPPRAQERGITGWVLVEFTITPTGAVKDPVVVDSEPSSIFNRAALRSIRKWKYKPKIVDGVAVERSGIQTQLTFELED
jgi:protein TonB